MRFSHMVLCACLGLKAMVAIAEDSNWSMAANPKYFKIGASWDTSSTYSGTTAELQSPAFSYKHPNGSSSEFSAFIARSHADLKNVIVDEASGKYDTAKNSIESVGLAWRVSQPDFPISTYIMLAGAHLSADKRLAEFDHPNWGFRFTFGFEIPLPRASDEFYTSVFIQQTSTTGLGKADKLEHSPDYFNTNPISLGVRVGI